MSTKRARENTSHSVDYLRAQGYHVEFVERWVPGEITKGFIGGPGIKKDLFGIMDLLAVRPGEILGVQVGSLNGRASHKVKILAEPRTWDWIQSGARLVIHSWDRTEVATSSKGALSPTKISWRLTEDEILPDHLSLDADKIQTAVLKRMGGEVAS